jgi:O-antigen/teichoic acid export membrane protein
MAVSGLFNWGYYASQRWALQLFVSTDEVGKFYALTQIAYVPILLGGSLFLSLITPIFYARGGDLGDQQRLKETYQIVLYSSIIFLFATFTIALISLLIHKMIFGLFLGPGYQVVSIFMPAMVMAAGFTQISIIMGSIVSINNQTSKILPLAIFGNFFIAGMNLFFTSKWAINGLIISILIGSLIHLIWMGTIVYKQTRDLAT